jgi:hypothetical protein
MHISRLDLNLLVIFDAIYAEGVNYSPNKVNNFTLRTEFFIDPEGQRTWRSYQLRRYRSGLAAFAHCGNSVALTCTADEQSFPLYVKLRCVPKLPTTIAR